jgi:anti-anti-sigma factor
MDSRVPDQACGNDLPRVPPPGGPEFPLQARFTQHPPVLHLAGDIDESTYPGLTEVLAGVAAAGWPLIHVDLAGVDYCDVAGLRAIVSLACRPGNGEASRPGNVPATIEQIVLAHLPASLMSVLRILGWDAVPGLILEDCSC